MAHSQDESMNSFLQDYSRRSTLNTLRQAKRIRLPKTPMGKEALIYKVGDIVQSTECGGYKAGYVMKVEMAELNHGWARYYAANMWHRSQDVEAVK